MEDLTQDELIQYRGVYLGNVAKMLGISKENLCQGVADQLEISSESVQDYMAGKTPLPTKIQFDKFRDAINFTINDYVRNTNINESKRKRVEQNWSTHKETIHNALAILFMDIEGPYPFPNNKDRAEEKIDIALSKLEQIFLIDLNQEFAYKLQKNYEILSSTTKDDIAFLAGMLDMSDVQKESLRVRLSEIGGLTAGDMLQILTNGEVKQWINFRDGNHQKYCSDKGKFSPEGNWQRFREKAIAHFPRFVQFTFFFYRAINIKNPKEVRFKEKEIDLFLLFKYCISPEQQAQTLQDIAKNKAAGEP